jgi:hypothetical protein
MRYLAASEVFTEVNLTKEAFYGVGALRTLVGDVSVAERDQPSVR